MNDTTRIEAVLDYWFGSLNEHGTCADGQQKLWFQSRPETDEHIEQEFGAWVEAALAGELDHWAATPAGRMALVLLLDQFPRNIYRGTPRAFAGDERALALAQDAVAEGIDRSMPAIHRVFLYIPYEHCESLPQQEAGISRFDELLAVCDPAIRAEVDGFRDYMVAHRDVIAAFGRFPHRNHILGRESTEEERAHLEKHGGF